LGLGLLLLLLPWATGSLESGLLVKNYLSGCQAFRNGVWWGAELQQLPPGSPAVLGFRLLE